MGVRERAGLSRGMGGGRGARGAGGGGGPGEDRGWGMVFGDVRPSHREWDATGHEPHLLPATLLQRLLWPV